MRRLSAVVEECIVDWRENEQRAVRILELRVRYGNRKYSDFLEFIKGGYPHLARNVWLVDPSKLTEGTTIALENFPNRKYTDRNLVYPQSSPINPLTPDFQRELYEKLHQIATQDYVKLLYLKQYEPATDLDLQARILPGHCFIHSNGRINACSDFIVSGRFKKRICEKEYILYGAKGGKENNSGGLFFDGDLTHLEPEMIITKDPKMRFRFSRRITKSDREALWNLVRKWALTISVAGISEYWIEKDGLVPNGTINGLELNYHNNDGEFLEPLQVILSRMHMRQTEKGNYILS